MRTYGRKACSKDMLAGLNVALLAFPQGMAYAYIAGVPLKYGIFGSAAATIFGMFFAGSRFIVLGPTNATSIMLLSAFVSLGVSGEDKLVLIPLLLVMVGAFLVIGAYLRVAGLIQYISRTVVTGYITAAALLIIANQVRHVFGLQLENPPTIFLSILGQSIGNLAHYHWPTLVVALLTCVTYWSLSRFKRCPNVALTLLVMSLVTWLMKNPLATWLQALGHVQPASAFEGLQFLYWDDGGSRYLPRFDFGDIGRLAGTAQAIALLCVLEGISIGKSLAARTGGRIDANQEMLSMGMANIACGFFSGMPASGSLTRSVLNSTSGAATPLASFFTGSICLVGALTLAPLVNYVPRAALAVLVIIIGCSLINRYHILMSLKATKSDASVFVVTLGAGLLLPLDTAIYFGTALTILLFLRKVAIPELAEYSLTKDGHFTKMERRQKRSNPSISIVHVEGKIFFAAAEVFQDQIRRICEDPNLRVVVLKMRHAHNMDATSIMALEELIQYMREKNRTLLISEIREKATGIFKRTGLYSYLGTENVFLDDAQNPNLSTALALRRAQEIVGEKQIDVKIFAERNDPSQEENL